MRRNRCYRYCVPYTGGSHTHSWFERSANSASTIERRANMFGSVLNEFEEFLLLLRVVYVANMLVVASRWVRLKLWGNYKRRPTTFCLRLLIAGWARNSEWRAKQISSWKIARTCNHIWTHFFTWEREHLVSCRRPFGGQCQGKC